MRLIDADALMEKFLKMQRTNKEIPLLEEDLNNPEVNNYENGQQETFELIIEHLEKTETAYDVEKVVEQLEERRKRRTGVLRFILGEAIEVVRKGGVE